MTDDNEKQWGNYDGSLVGDDVLIYEIAEAHGVRPEQVEHYFWNYIITYKNVEEAMP